MAICDILLLRAAFAAVCIYQLCHGVNEAIGRSHFRSLYSRNKPDDEQL